MTLDMLRSAPRPDDVFAQRRSSVPVAWKTGTSWAFRDAWTAGVFGPYVLVVWVGNFDGSGNPAQERQQDSRESACSSPSIAGR